MKHMKPAKAVAISRPVVSLTITIMVLLSPVMIFVNPLSVSASSIISDKVKADRIDTSSYHVDQSTSPVTTTTTTLSSPDSSLSTPSSPSPSMTTGTPTIQGPLTSPSTKQTNNIVNTQSEFLVSFKTSTIGIIKKILVTFPAGTNIGSVNLLITREGIGPGTAEKTSSTTITYTVDSAVSVPAGTLIKLEFGTIVNSPNPGNQFVTVSTRTAANAIIDGPTAIGYSLKQIGTADIASGAIPQGVIQRASALVDIDPDSNLLVTSPPCLPSEDIQGGGYGTTSNGLVNIAAEFSVDSDADGFLDSWRILAFNLDTVNTWQVQSIAECGVPGPP